MTLLECEVVWDGELVCVSLCDCMLPLALNHYTSALLRISPSQLSD